MLREHKIESPSDPASLAVGDQRSYLYVAVTHDTDPTASAGGMGLAVDVRLKHDPTTYSSNHGIALWTFMLGMAGFPLTGGIFGKLFVFSAAYDAGEWWLVLIGVVATAISLGYYLNVVRWLYMRSGAELRLAVAGGSPPRDPALGVAAAASVVVTVGSFFVVQPILDVASDAASALPF